MQNKPYFNNLNALRVAAAFAIIISHTEQLKSITGVESLWRLAFIISLGPKAVLLFFVLSGFLVTYLLLNEQQVSGAINTRRFHYRRGLRILPLYCLVIIASFFIFPYIVNFAPNFYQFSHAYYSKFLLFAFLLPNVSLILYKPVPFAAHLWYLGVEEQYHLVSPLLARCKSALPAIAVSFIILRGLMLSNPHIMGITGMGLF